MSLPYYKRYPRDFLEGTIGMTLEEKGAYSILLDLIYARDGSLPDDAGYISGNLGCSVRKWSVVRNALIEKGKIFVENGIIFNSRAWAELESSRSYQEKQRGNGLKPKQVRHLKKPTLKPKLNQSEPEPEEVAKATSVSVPSEPRPIVKIRCEEFDEAWRLWPQKGRSAKSKSLALWKAKSSISDPALMLAAVKRYLAGPDARKDAGAFVPALERWIRDRLESWLEVGVALTSPASADMQAKIFSETGVWLAEWGPKPKPQLEPEFQLLRGVQA